MKWFRLYSEARTDAKLESLPDDMFRVWFKLMCFAGEQPTRGFVEGYDDELLAVEVARGDVELLRATLIELSRLEIIAQDSASILISNGQCYKPERDALRPSPSVWARLRSAVFARDDYTCRYCGVRGTQLECDHVMPVSRGGSNGLDNLVTACIGCNRSKRDKTPEEWAG